MTHNEAMRRARRGLVVTTIAAVAGAGLTGCQNSSAKSEAHPVSAPTHKAANYLYTSLGDYDAQAKPLLGRPDIQGVQIVVPWKAMERQKDRYDFSEVDRVLNQATVLHKKVFIQVQDRFFQLPARLPQYLLKGPQFAGGAAPTNNENGLGKGEPGAIAAQWNANVRDRFQHLLKALAQRYDGRIAGVNLPESSTDVDKAKDKTGFTPDSYFKAELENMAYAKKVFKRSKVVQYVNFWPDEWNNSKRYMERAFAFAAQHGIGLGGPDVLPYKEAQMKNSYPFFHRYRGKLSLTAMAIQEPDFEYKNPKTNKPYTRQEFVDFANDYLGADIIFWATSAPWLHQKNTS